MECDDCFSQTLNCHLSVCNLFIFRNTVCRDVLNDQYLNLISYYVLTDVIICSTVSALFFRTVISVSNDSILHM